MAGPSVAMGYWKRPQETEQVFGAELADAGEQRFLRTGDLGFIRDGYLFITGRLKELIIIRGRNYYPQDIERTARESCPAIRLGTGAAFSVSATTGERMVLVQEIHRRQKVDADQIFRSIREAIAEEHEVQIHEIVLVTPGSVPRTSSGKIQRNLCRKEFLEGRLEVTEQWRAEEGLQIAEHVHVWTMRVFRAGWSRKLLPRLELIRTESTFIVPFCHWAWTH